jgi:hypothetical protein
MSHAFTEKVLSWYYCRHCGLIKLKNEATKRAKCE